MHEHTHSHDHGATPQEELTALLHYMVHHNEAHAKELAGLARQLTEAGKQPVSETVLKRRLQACAFPRSIGMR